MGIKINLNGGSASSNVSAKLNSKAKPPVSVFAEKKDVLREMVEPLRDERISIENLLIFATENNCSDLYITVGEKPFLSKFGGIIRVPCKAISKDEWAIFYSKYILNELNADYVRQKLLDTSVGIRIPETSSNYGKFVNNQYRYRVSFGFTQEKNLATFRMIKPQKPTFETINYDPACVAALRKAYSRPSGICYETGPTGSGKSTTMAACINSFTQPGDILDNKVFITLEDPIENMFESTDTVRICQKELGKDFLTFALGIKAALREHPNIIVVGECRDKEVICAAIEAARTGHITSTTFHASDVSGTIRRLLYHLDNDKNLSMDLILQLNIILAQKMLKQDGQYLVDTQFMLFDDEITSILTTLLDTPDVNMAVEIDKIIANPYYQEKGLVKDWSYKHLHKSD